MRKFLTYFILVIFISLIIYVAINFRSGINTLRPSDGHEILAYESIQENLDDRKNYFIWIGQATVLLNMNDRNVLFDPIFSDRASPLSFFGPKRTIPPVIKIEDLPIIDIIFISHNHYDHLDLESLKAIQQKFPDVVINVPRGDKQLLISEGFKNINEFEWWQREKIYDFEIVFTPTNHWSARTLFDRKKSLWGGWFIKTEDYSILHIGDTAKDRVYEEYPKRLSDIDITFMPIGSYLPRNIEAEYHVDPHEAIEIVQTLNTKFAYGIHWGGIFFQQEPTYEPLEIIKNARMLNEELKFYTPLPGEIIDLP